MTARARNRYQRRKGLEIGYSGLGNSSSDITVGFKSKRSKLVRDRFSQSSPQRGTADSEIKAPSAENQELAKVHSFKPGVDQNIALHASPAAKNPAYF